jgi:hypothetical protein
MGAMGPAVANTGGQERVSVEVDENFIAANEEARS